VYPTDRFPAPPAAERLPEYVAANVGDYGPHTETLLVEWRGIARFGTHETFTQLRTALSTADDEAAYVIGEALRALTFEDEVLSAVDSGVAGLDVWLKRRALQNETSGASRTYVVSADGRVVGYCALATGAVVIARSVASGAV
jgi:hypothetical protein